jgi:hypothetical protein
MREQLTLGRALAMVGGVAKEAKISDIRIYRQKPGSPEQVTIHVDYSAIKKNQKPDVVLEAFDIIEVPEAGMFSASRLPTTLMGAVSGVFNGAITASGQILPTRILY